MNEIKCNVTNCMYHSGATNCTAKEIQVASQCKKNRANAARPSAVLLNRKTNAVLIKFESGIS